MTLEDKKDMVLQMIGLHPSENWYRQCLEMHMTAEEISIIEKDVDFLREVKGVLFMEKQRLMQYRKNAIEMSAARGGWQGYDKLLQEVDRETFNVSKDINLAGKELSDRPVQIVLVGKKSDTDS